MKKTLATISAMLATLVSFAQDGAFPTSSLLHPSLSLVSVSAAVGYESEYVFRGEKRGEHAIQPKVDFSYPVVGFDLYAGAWANLPILKSSESNLKEFDLYGGATYTYSAAKVDVGYICYYYPESSDWDGSSRDMEAYVGITFDTSTVLWGYNVNPSVYYAYNWVLRQQVVEVSFGYDAPVGLWAFGFKELTLPVNIYAGYASAGQMNGDNGGPDLTQTWWYVGGSVDIAYAVTDYCTISAGVRYCKRSGGDEGEVTLSPSEYGLSGRMDNIWFGGKVDFGF